MSTPEIDERLAKIRASLQTVEEGTREVGEVFRLYEEKIASIDANRAKAEQAAKEAEVRAAEAIEKYDKMLVLQRGKSQEIIAELFEKPSSELKSVISGAAESSNNLTRRTTMASIALTVGIAVASIILSYLQGRDLNKQLDLTAKRLSEVSSGIPVIREDLRAEIDNFEPKLHELNRRLDEIDTKTARLAATVDRREEAINSDLQKLSSSSEASSKRILAVRDKIESIGTQLSGLDQRLGQINATYSDLSRKLPQIGSTRFAKQSSTSTPAKLTSDDSGRSLSAVSRLSPAEALGSYLRWVSIRSIEISAAVTSRAPETL